LILEISAEAAEGLIPPPATALASTASTTATAASTTATAASATATAASITTAAASAASAAPSAFARGTRLVDDNVTAHEVMAVEGLDRAAGIVVVIHFDEAKPTRLSGKAVPDQRHIGRCNARLRKPTAYVLLGSLERQVAHIEFLHETDSFTPRRSKSAGLRLKRQGQIRWQS
jgi:hypothetical protein